MWRLAAVFSRGVTVPPASSLWGVRAACSVAVETAVQRDSPLAEPAHQVRGERFRNRKAIWRDFQKELLVQETSGRPNHRRLLGFLNMCHGVVIAEPPDVKVKLADEMWSILRTKGLKPEVHIYNILLHVYNTNDHVFKPSEFVEEMQINDVSPNLGTFTQLVAAYCNQGNVSGATKLLEYMKSLDFPISESIYASLVTGHARAGNMEAAERVITNMKENRHTPHNVVYTSLLCAYAERGDIDSIVKLFGQMRGENLFPAMMGYTKVMDVLSKYGHGVLVNQVMDLIKNKEWLSADFRSLAWSCLNRGEVLAPRIFIKQLTQQNGLHRMLVMMYIDKCLELGQPVGKVLDDLSTDVDMGQFPQIYSSIVTKVMFKHPPVVVARMAMESPPNRGAMAPHPQGALWAENLLDLYSRIPRDGQSTVPAHFYYPLLARHCSDGNMAGFVECIKQRVMMCMPITRPMMLYTNKMMQNAGTTMMDYLKEKIQGGDGDMAIPLFGFLFYCNLGDFKAAQEFVGYLKDSDVLLEHVRPVSSAIRSGSLACGFNEDFVDLFKLLHSLPHPLPLTKSLNFCLSTFHANGMPLAPFLDLFSSLEFHKVDVVTPHNYLMLMKKLGKEDGGLFKLVYLKLKRDFHLLTPNDKVTLFKAAVKTGCYGTAKIVYKQLPDEEMKRPDVQQNYLHCLSKFENTALEGMDLLNAMLGEGHTLNYMSWFNLIPQVLRVDSAKGTQLLQQMQSHGLKPNEALRQMCLQHYVQNRNVEEATVQFDALKSEGWANLKSYVAMASLWAELGDLEQLHEIVQETEAKEIAGRSQVLAPLQIKAQLKNGGFDEVVALLEDKDLILPLPTVSSILTEFIRAGRPLDTVIAYLEKSSLTPSTRNSLLFFACVDNRDEERAASVLQEIDLLNRPLFDQYMSKPNAVEYLRVLKACEYHLKNINCAYLLKSGYLMLNDKKGTSDLIAELSKNGKTDWLWR